MRCHKLSPQEALLQSLSDALEPPVLEVRVGGVERVACWKSPPTAGT